MTLLIATHNAGKLREYRALLAHLGVELRWLAQVADAPAVDETGNSYLANARAKAQALAAHTGLPALADDSGLEVDALGGAPGVRSARFAADAIQGALPGDERANLTLLLERLRGVPHERRSARFRCTIVVAHPGGRELIADGTCEGLITSVPRGGAGFGYDPVFFHPALGRTFAELTAAEKNQVSHRARAVGQLRRTWW